MNEGKFYDHFFFGTQFSFKFQIEKKEKYHRKSEKRRQTKIKLSNRRGPSYSLP